MPSRPENMDKVAALRTDLNGRRAAAIQKYMATQFGPPVEYEVFVHDAPVPSIYGVFAGNAYRGQATRLRRRSQRRQRLGLRRRRRQLAARLRRPVP